MLCRRTRHLLRLAATTNGVGVPAANPATWQRHRPQVVAQYRQPWGVSNVQRRRFGFGLEAVSKVLVPPVVFLGLLVTLWTYKCAMMVVFQNKIIYMPSVPPFSRSEKVADYAAQCKPVVWTEHDIKASDGTALKLLEGTLSTVTSAELDNQPKQRIIVLYLQGNASSLPPRLPYLSSILKSLAVDTTTARQYTIVALSYRGFWQSRGRPTQSGIELDAEAAFEWLLKRCTTNDHQETKIVVWGQSIGAGVATVGLSNLLKKHDPDSVSSKGVSGLLLETPFVDLKSMLVALYPQKFLPYRYLAPFLRSSWDSKSSLKRIGNAKTGLKTLILEAGNDEIVPAGQAEILEKVCKSYDMDVARTVIPGALHTEVMVKAQGRRHIISFLRSF